MTNCSPNWRLFRRGLTGLFLLSLTLVLSVAFNYRYFLLWAINGEFDFRRYTNNFSMALATGVESEFGIPVVAMFTIYNVVLSLRPDNCVHSQVEIEGEGFYDSTIVSRPQLYLRRGSVVQRVSWLGLSNCSRVDLRSPPGPFRVVVDQCTLAKNVRHAHFVYDLSYSSTRPIFFVP